MATKKKEEETEDTALEEALKAIRKDIGADNVLVGDTFEVERWSTGFAGLDKVMGGGLPKGRIIESHGLESTGKSSIFLAICAAVQRAGGKAAWLDLECTYDTKFASMMGVDGSEMTVLRPNSGEEAFRAVAKLAEAGVDIIVLDSAAAVLSDKEVEEEFGEAGNAYGSTARLLSSGLKKVQPILARSGSILCIVNQMRANVNAKGPYDAKHIVTGGQAMKFYASVRIQTRKKEQLKDGDGKPIGMIVSLKGEKCKVGRQGLETEVKFMHDTGFDDVDNLVRTAVEFGVITVQGNSHSFGESKLGVGFEKTVEAVRADEGVEGSIRGALDEKINPKNQAPCGK
jgi:recombination protein RecA